MLIDEAETVDDAEHERLLAKAEAEGITPTFEADVSPPRATCSTAWTCSATAAFEQVAEAAECAAGIEGLPAADEVDNVLVLGMGVGGLAGDLLAAVGGPFVPVPLVVAKGYGPPSFVGPGTLCFAVSFSGDTEETVEAAQAAASAGARMVVVARGGELGALAPAGGRRMCGCPTELPMSRRPRDPCRCR